MADAAWEIPPEDEPYPGGVFGDRLDWDGDIEDIYLAVELPFWLMVPSSPLEIQVSDWNVVVEIRGDYLELHAGEVSDAKGSCIYLGPDPSKVDAAAVPNDVPVTVRDCKTVLRLPARCLSDALAAVGDGYWRTREAMAYFGALCAAHVPAVNEVITRYRLASYDYFPFEVSPWDVPIWFVQSQRGHVMVPLLPYRSWDRKPLVNGELMSLVTPEELAVGRSLPEPGELELLDALMLMERGDYSGAVRRVVTAVEVGLEGRLRAELTRAHSSDEVERRLEASKNDFPGRLRQWSKLSGRVLPDAVSSELEITRSIRHEIVHRGRRIPYAERGVAQRAVDTSRWAFNFIEGRSELAELRETRLALRSIGRFSAGMHFLAELTPNGVVVTWESFDDADDSGDTPNQDG